MQKAADAFRTISEVSQTLDVPQHVLRFWEGKFPAIKPLKRAGGRRYYRPEDIDLLRGVRTLLYAEGYTVKGVQKLLREGGAKHICEIGRIGLRKAGRPAEHATPAQLVVTTPQGAAEMPDGIAGRDVEASEMAHEASPLARNRERLEAALAELLNLRDLLRAGQQKNIGDDAAEAA